VTVAVRSPREGSSERKLETTVEDGSNLVAVRFSPDAQLLALSAGQRALAGVWTDTRVLSLRDGALRFELLHGADDGFYALGFTSRNEVVVRHDRFPSSEAPRNTIDVYSPAGALLRSFEQKDQSLRGDHLIQVESGGERPGIRYTCKLTDLVSGHVRTIELPFEPEHFAVSPSGDRVALFSPEAPWAVEVWDTRAGAH
jgi:hypothetical protein